jgi:hypothetical protein
VANCLEPHVRLPLVEGLRFETLNPRLVTLTGDLPNPWLGLGQQLLTLGSCAWSSLCTAVLH